MAVFIPHVLYSILEPVIPSVRSARRQCTQQHLPTFEVILPIAPVHVPQEARDPTSLLVRREAAHALEE